MQYALVDKERRESFPDGRGISWDAEGQDWGGIAVKKSVARGTART